MFAKCTRQKYADFQCHPKEEFPQAKPVAVSLDKYPLFFRTKPNEKKAVGQNTPIIRTK
jgi:hypothetical protein